MENYCTTIGGYSCCYFLYKFVLHYNTQKFIYIRPKLILFCCVLCMFVCVNNNNNNNIKCTL